MWMERGFKAAILAGVALTPIMLGEAMAQTAPQDEREVVVVTGTRVENRSALDTAVAAGLPPDAIISDIGLPEEDGYRLMEQISGRPKSQGGEIPVIAVTAYGRPQDKRRALAAGFRLHLTKPVTPGALASAVASVLKR